MPDFSYKQMFLDIERVDDFQRMARDADCPTGDYAFGGFACSKTLGLNSTTTTTSESPVWRTIVGKAKRDSAVHSRKIAAMAGEAECWIKVADVWWSAMVHLIVDQVATLVTSCGTQHIIPVNEIAFECPCRWPV
jgi:hypothetical protein